MKRKLLLVVWFLCSLFIASAQRKYNKETIEKYQLDYSPPMKYFRFSKIKNKSFPTILDSTAVYISKGYDSEIKDSIISFVRFYGNNICFSSHPYNSTPSDNEFNQTDYGSWCMYKVKNKEIILEYYETLNIPKRFFLSYGRIETDSITWYKKRLGRFLLFSAEKLDAIDIKRKVHFTNYTINWK